MFVPMRPACRDGCWAQEACFWGQKPQHATHSPRHLDMDAFMACIWPILLFSGVLVLENWFWGPGGCFGVCTHGHVCCDGCETFFGPRMLALLVQNPQHVTHNPRHPVLDAFMASFWPVLLFSGVLVLGKVVWGPGSWFWGPGGRFGAHSPIMPNTPMAPGTSAGTATMWQLAGTDVGVLVPCAWGLLWACMGHMSFLRVCLCAFWETACMGAMGLCSFVCFKGS